MSAEKVDVLAVMEDAQSRLFGLSATASDIEVHDRMIDARDAVAELIVAAQNVMGSSFARNYILCNPFKELGVALAKVTP